MTQPNTIPNRYPAPCTTCNAYVAANAGTYHRDTRRVYCVEHNPAGGASDKPLPTLRTLDAAIHMYRRTMRDADASPAAREITLETLLAVGYCVGARCMSQVRAVIDEETDALENRKRDPRLAAAVDEILDGILGPTAAPETAPEAASEQVIVEVAAPTPATRAARSTGRKPTWSKKGNK